MQKRSGGFRTHSRFDPLIGVCVGCRDAGARGAFQRCMLRCAMRADAGSFLRPTARGKGTSRRLRAPQTPGERPRSPFHPARRARCAHTSHGAAPGPQQPANNPTLLPLPVSPGHVARTPRSAGQQPSAADADASTGGQNLAGAAPGLQQPPNNPTLLPLPVTPVAARTGPVSCGARAPCRGAQQPRAAGEGFSGQNLFSSQAASGTPAAGAAASSARAPHGRLEADIGGDATRQRKREAAERLLASRGGYGHPSNFRAYGVEHGWRAAHFVEKDCCVAAGAECSSGSFRPTAD